MIRAFNTFWTNLRFDSVSLNVFGYVVPPGVETSCPLICSIAFMQQMGKKFLNLEHELELFPIPAPFDSVASSLAQDRGLPLILLIGIGKGAGAGIRSGSSASSSKFPLLGLNAYLLSNYVPHYLCPISCQVPS